MEELGNLSLDYWDVVGFFRTCSIISNTTADDNILEDFVGVQLEPVGMVECGSGLCASTLEQMLNAIGIFLMGWCHLCSILIFSETSTSWQCLCR
jgi:hypothetical protein